jgi:hypothetical protein
MSVKNEHSRSFDHLLTHAPPSFNDGHYDMVPKRQRSNSVSGRLRSASDLEERGLIDRYQKGVLKDLIISGDEQLQRALDQYENGDPSELESLMAKGVFNRKGSMDLLEELDMDCLNVGPLGKSPATGPMHPQQGHSHPQQLDLDEIPFEASFGDDDIGGGGFNDPLGHRGDQPGQQRHPSFEAFGNNLGGQRAGGCGGSFDGSGLGIGGGQMGMGGMDGSHGLANPFGFPDDILGKGKDGSGSPQFPSRMGDASVSSIGLGGHHHHHHHHHNHSHHHHHSNHHHHLDDMAGLDGLPQQQYIGSYSPEARRQRIDRFIEKRKRRVWTKKVKYDVRKNFADSRLRVKGRFVKKEDEELLRELIGMT